MSSQLPILTRKDFQAALARHNVSQAEAGVYDAVNEYLSEKIDTATRVASLNAEHEGRTTLNAKDGEVSIASIAEMPRTLF